MESCQEEKDKCYFVYGHYKSDTNELFYIGIGKRRKGAFHSQIYARAYQCSSWSRNYLWLRCFNKHGRIVKILYDNLTEEEIFQLSTIFDVYFYKTIKNIGRELHRTKNLKCNKLVAVLNKYK